MRYEKGTKEGTELTTYSGGNIFQIPNLGLFIYQKYFCQSNNPDSLKVALSISFNVKFKKHSPQR